jgi:lambda repressor-like predicted transcriptional regulator
MTSKLNRYTVVGTDIEEVKRLNRQSGLSYNEVKQLLAKQYLKMKQ